MNPQVRDDGKSEENLGSFYMGRMRQPVAPPRRLMPKGVLTIFMLACFGAIIWYAYPQGQEKYSDIDIPVISASKEPYKFKPDDPGGMEVRHQDSTVFDPLEKDGARHVEKLRPQTEEPMNKAEVLKSTSPIDQTPHSLDLKEVAPQNEKDTAEKNASETATPEKGTPEKIMTADNDKEAAQPDSEPGDDKPAAADKSDKPDTAAAAQPAKPAAPATPAKPAPKAAAPTAKPKAAAGKGPYVQLGAYHDLAGAKKEWGLLQKKYPETLGKLQMHTEQVDLGAKGVLTRLQAAAPTEARAKTVCDALKADKQACIVVH